MSPSLSLHHRAISRRSAVARIASVTAGAVALANGSLVTTAQESSPRTASTPQATPSSSAPTVVLVHGSFADASGWAGVIALLEDAGIPTVAPANPQRGISSDAAYIASFANQIEGPVLLVGHSYGGAVISNAAPLVPSAVGLVYAAGFIPDEGETILGLAEQATDSHLGPALRVTGYPLPDGTTGQEFSIDPALFHEVFCADLPADLAFTMARSQRPASDISFGEPSGQVGWKTLPSWAVIPMADFAIGVSGLRAMADRAGASTIDVEGSHAVMISNPQVVADLIQQALASLV